MTCRRTLDWLGLDCERENSPVLESGNDDEARSWGRGERCSAAIEGQFGTRGPVDVVGTGDRAFVWWPGTVYRSTNRG
jgi:hypothetical protein